MSAQVSDIWQKYTPIQGFPCGTSGKEPACQCRRIKRSLGREDPLRRTWQPIPVFLLGESPWIEDPGRLQSIGLQRVRYCWNNLTQHILHLYNPGPIKLENIFVSPERDLLHVKSVSSLPPMVPVHHWSDFYPYRYSLPVLEFKINGLIQDLFFLPTFFHSVYLEIYPWCFVY